MAEALTRFRLHFPVWLNTERNHKTLLRFRKGQGLTEFNYRVLVALWNELAHVEGALDLDETEAPSNPYYVGQITPGAEFDVDYAPRKRVSEMSADEFTRAIAKNPKFRARIDGTE